MYVDQMCALTWFLWTKDLEPAAIEYKKAQLWIPPEGVDIDERSPWHPANQISQLQKVKGAQRQIPPREGARATLSSSRDAPPPRPIPGSEARG